MSAKPLEASAANEIDSDSGVRAIDTTVATFQQIDAALAPIIGQRGTAALFKRSLQQTSAHHPWLASACAGDAPLTDYFCLESALGSRTPAEAAAAGTALVGSFIALLAGLVGHPLTERLLRSVEAARSHSPHLQETTR